MELYYDNNPEYFQNLDKMLDNTKPLYNKNEEWNYYNKNNCLLFAKVKISKSKH